jgi:hypothetical protein
MRARRDAIDGIADQFYRWLASEVDVHATDKDDRAEVIRHPDGRLELTLAPRGTAAAAQDGGPASDGEAAAAGPYYRRVFLPHETSEVRVFLHGGDDMAIVRGANDAIAVRLVGGGGDDVLADSSGAGSVHLYDDRGENRFVRAAGTSVDERAWVAPHPPEGLRVGMAWAPDWGGSSGWSASADYQEAGGVIVGAGRRWTDNGFRRLPWHWHVEARALLALGTGEPGVELSADYRPENSRNSLRADVRWSGYDGFRWFGAGNDSQPLASGVSLVRMDRFSFEPAFVKRFGPRPAVVEDSAAQAEADSATAAAEPALEPPRATVSVGPVLYHTTTSAAPESPFALAQPLGFESTWQTGVAARLELAVTDGRISPRRGMRLRARVAAYPGVLDMPGAAADAAAELNAYVPLIGDGLRLAVRAGALGAVGDYAAWDAPRIGGKATLRGFEFQRFAGDAAAYGGAELRAPLGEVELLTRGDLGVFALADVGRVWVDGESPGGWHAAYGGGISFETLGRALSVALASGEREQLYIWLGFPF